LITSFSRKTLLQSSAPGIEALTREHIMQELAVAIDLGVLKGTASAGQPRGITQTSNIFTKDSSSANPAWSDILDVQALVEGADVAPESLGWALNAFTKAKMRSIVKVSGDAGAGFLMDDAGNIGGAPSAITSQLVGDPEQSPVEDGEAIYGAWNQFILAMWSGIELLANPFESTAYSKGHISVRGIVDADTLCRHPQAFVHWSGIKVD
jgi:HK97 family phage major capsid protein